MQDAITFAAGVAECEVETKAAEELPRLPVQAQDDDAVTLAATALARCGFEPRYALSGGAADANVFNERGLQCVNLANGMADIHTPDEHIAVADLDGDGRRDARARRRGPRRLIEERRLGPVVGLGTWNTFGSDAALAREVVGAALESGHAVFDSSPMYRGAERSLGRGARGPPRRGDVATKIWAQSVDEGREQYRAPVRMVRPGRDRADPQPRELARAARMARGGARSRACRQARRHALRGARVRRAGGGASHRPFDTVQLPYNPHEREVERELLPLAAELGVAVIVMRPLGGGALVRRAPAAAELAPLARVRRRDVGASAPQVGALGRPHRSRDPGDLATGAAGRNAAAGSPPWFGPDERALVERLAA